MRREPIPGRKARAGELAPAPGRQQKAGERIASKALQATIAQVEAMERRAESEGEYARASRLAHAAKRLRALERSHKAQSARKGGDA